MWGGSLLPLPVPAPDLLRVDTFKGACSPNNAKGNPFSFNSAPFSLHPAFLFISLTKKIVSFFFIPYNMLLLFCVFLSVACTRKLLSNTHYTCYKRRPMCTWHWPWLCTRLYRLSNLFVLFFLLFSLYCCSFLFFLFGAEEQFSSNALLLGVEYRFSPLSELFDFSWFILVWWIW